MHRCALTHVVDDGRWRLGHHIVGELSNAGLYTVNGTVRQGIVSGGLYEEYP